MKYFRIFEYKKSKLKIFGGITIRKGIFKDKAIANGYKDTIEFAKVVLKDPEKWKKKLKDPDIVKQASLALNFSKMA